MTCAPIQGIAVSAHTVPTDAPETDGTLEWESTTVIVVQVRAADRVGLGWTYGHASAAALVGDVLADAVIGRDATQVRARWDDMVRAVRNIGLPGVAAYAISAVDTALWDLKARVLDQPLVDVLDARHESLPLYGSGGFTSYDDDRLATQLARWAEGGIPRVKMKVGRQPARDVDRVAVARSAIGESVELYVDANGALHRQQALAAADAFAELGVTWFEEPVSSDDVDGLRLLRDRSPAGMEIAAGEYGTVLSHFATLLDRGAVDCLQADVTRCGGITGLLSVGALCQSAGIDLSAHTAPQLSAHAFSPIKRLRHLEWFHDHVRIERLLFDGTLEPVEGALHPDRERAGHGLSFKHQDAAAYLVARSTTP